MNSYEFYKLFKNIFLTLMSAHRLILSFGAQTSSKATFRKFWVMSCKIWMTQRLNEWNFAKIIMFRLHVNVEEWRVIDGSDEFSGTTIYHHFHHSHVEDPELLSSTIINCDLLKQWRRKFGAFDFPKEEVSGADQLRDWGLLPAEFTTRKDTHCPMLSRLVCG